MIKLHYLKNFLKKLTPLLFIISIFSHLSVSTIIDDLFTRSDNSYILRLKLILLFQCGYCLQWSKLYTVLHFLYLEYNT